MTGKDLDAPETDKTSEQLFLAALGVYDEVATSTELDEALQRQGADLADRIRDFSVLVPVVGSFNAGKTSLINAYLRRDGQHGLPTAIVPQTALATEIHPAAEGDPEQVELLGEDDRVVRRLNLAEFGRFETKVVSGPRQDVQHARARLNSDMIRPDTRVVLVDMPGLDSGLQNHNAAILRYLPLGGYFVLVVDVERGGLRESEIGQLREFLEREVEFTVLANKADRKQADRDQVVAHISAQVRDAFGKDAPVHAVSALRGDIAAFSETFESIDPDRALRNYWRSPLLRLFDQAIVSLHTRYSAINVSDADAQDVIDELEQSRADLEAKLAEDEREIRGRYSERATDRIVREVRNEIRDDADRLVAAYENGGNTAFEQELNELVRTTLSRSLESAWAETHSEIGERYRANIDGLDAQLRRFNESASDGSYATGARLGSAFKAATEASSQAFKAAAEQASSVRWESVFSTAAGVFSALTSVVLPWIEVALILLPWIVKLFGAQRERERQLEQEQQQRVQLRNHITNTVAPKIASQLRDRVAEDYTRLASGMLSSLRSEMEVQIQRVQADIKKSRADMKAGRQEAGARQEGLAAAIRTLTAEKGRIDNA